LVARLTGGRECPNFDTLCSGNFIEQSGLVLAKQGMAAFLFPSRRLV